jgi:hypothetical protein
MPRELIICRQPADFVRVRLYARAGATVASDDAAVQASAQAAGATVISLDATASFYVAAPEVQRLVAVINAAFQRRRPDAGTLPREVWEWEPNVEGGHTSQRVQDAVLFARASLSMIERAQPERIMIAHSPDAALAEQVLVACATAQDIPVEFFGRHTPRALVAAAKRLLFPYALAAYYVWALVREKLRAPATVDRAPAAIGFQLCSSRAKHVENVSGLMAAVNARGLSAIALCWAASERADQAPAWRQLRNQSLRAFALEAWVKWSEVISPLLLLFRAVPETNLATAAVDLGPALRPALRHFMVAELPQRIRYATALQRALVGNFEAFKPWGGPDLPEGAIACALLRHREPRPLLFHYWIGAALPTPYRAPAGRLDLFFAKGPQEVPLAAEAYGLTADQIPVVGFARLPDYAAFAARNSPRASRERLGLPTHARRYLGFDPNALLPGYQSATEQRAMLEALLSIAETNSDIVVVLKPHPSYAIPHLLPLLSDRDNVFVLDRGASLADFLNAIDLLVAKYSTLILEAAVLGRPTIAALLDGDRQFAVYGELPEYAFSVASLRRDLTELATNDTIFAAWRERRLQQAQRELPVLLHRGAEPPATLAAAALARSIQIRHDSNR